MSFFVSNSLKGIISEEDLSADSPIKIVEAKQKLTIHFCSDITGAFDVELIELCFGENSDEIQVLTSPTDTEKILKCANQKVEYSIFLNGNQYMQKKGTFILSKLQISNEDNYVMCKIDIYKRR